MYVAVKGGEKAVKNSRTLLKNICRGKKTIPRITNDQIENQLGLALDRVMAEGALYDKKAAGAAIKQAQGDITEAVFLVRAFRTTLKRFGNSLPIHTEKMTAIRRVSGIFKDIPGGQILGPTYDYTHRLIEFKDDEFEDHYQDNTDSEHGYDSGSEEFISAMDILYNQGLIKKEQELEMIGENPEDITRQPLKFPVSRSMRLQILARGDEGFLLGSAYSLQRGFGLNRHPFLGELKIGYVDIFHMPRELGFKICLGRVKITECFMVNRFDSTKETPAGFENGYGLVFGQNERKAMSIALLDRSLQNSRNSGKGKYPGQDHEFILAHSDNVESSGFVQHLKLPHYVDFQSELIFIRTQNKKTDNQKKEINQ